MAHAIQHQPDQTISNPQPDWALFLDIDGTLIDIAMTPDFVVVPEALVPLLARYESWLDGAIALVSGRPLDQIDRLMAPLVLPCASEHGAIIRLPDGTIETAGAKDAIPTRWRELLRAATRNMNGVVLENKSYGLAVHYRQAPAQARKVLELAQSIVAEDAARFEVLPASMAVEIRNRRLTKAAPVERFMNMRPFKGRVPVFIGDDVTDQDGMRAAEAMGGIGLDVHRSFGGRPSEVLRWLDASVPAQGR